MSLLKKMTSWMGGETSAPTRQVLIDGGALGASGQKGGRLAPRDQIGLLRRLGRFAEKEGLALHVVFAGESLRQVSSGDSFEGVSVFFTGTESGVDAMLEKQLGSMGARGTVVVVGSTEIEARMMRQGAEGIRPVTFRKALESVVGGGGEAGSRGGGRGRGERREGGRRSGGRPRRSSGGGSGGTSGGSGGTSGSGERERRRRPPSNRNGQRGGERPASRPPAREAAAPQRADGVDELIDLVD